MRSPLTARSEDFDGQAPLLFRAADMLRLEGVVAAVTQDGMSLALVSRHEAILDHYGKILVERLRAVAPEIGIEIYFPASAEALLARFNTALSDYTVQQAMEASVPIAPPKIWIVHDASALPDHEIQLLARLIQHFPGANIRIVMLLPQGSKKHKLLISCCKRLPYRLRHPHCLRRKQSPMMTRPCSRRRHPRHRLQRHRRRLMRCLMRPRKHQPQPHPGLPGAGPRG